MEEYSTAITQKSYSHNIRVNGLQIIEGKYRINELLSLCGDVSLYLADGIDKKVVIKFEPFTENSYIILKKISQLSFERLLPVLSYGVVGEILYSVYPYLQNGSLEGEKVSMEHMETIIKDINEGIYILHCAGMTHGDLKPSNIFWDDEKRHVYIGDYDACTYKENEYKRENVFGTLEYTVPTQNALISKKHFPEDDYGSMGMMILDIYTGCVHFAGKTEEAILQEWKNGIIIDASIPLRMRNIIKGLTALDGKYRFGYAEVRKWIEGDIVSVKDNNISLREKAKRVLPFGYVNGIVLKATTIIELSELMQKYPMVAKSKFFKSKNSLELLVDFVRQFNEEFVEHIYSIYDDNDVDTAVNKVAFLLNSKECISYQGKEYANILLLVEQLDWIVPEETFIGYIENGVLISYLHSLDNGELHTTMDELFAFAGSNSILMYYLIKYVLLDERCLHISSNKQIRNIQELVEYIHVNGFSFLRNKNSYYNVAAWLYVMGYKDSIEMFIQEKK